MASENHENMSKAEKINALTVKVFNDLTKLKWWVNDFYQPVIKRWPTWKEDEVIILWSLARQGGFMCILLNHVHLNIIKTINPLIIQENKSESDTFSAPDSYENLGNFVSACNDHLFISEASDFNQLELYLNNLEAYYTCLTIIDYLISRLKVRNPDMFQNNLVKPIFADEKPDPGIKDQKKLNHVCEEFLQTERSYVRKIEMILSVRIMLENSDNSEYKQSIATLDYFKSAVNFQQTFLLNLEAMFRHHKINRKIGKLFIAIGNEKTYNFEVYNEFCSNYKIILENVLKNLNSQPKSAKYMKIPADQLTSYFILPIQRLCKYPLLLKEYKKNLVPGSDIYKEIETAQKVAENAAKSINRYSKNAELRYEARIFVKCVNFFPDLPYSKYGSLLFFSPIIRMHNDIGREYILYIFKNVIVLCNEYPPRSENIMESTRVAIQSSLTIVGSIFPRMLLEFTDVSSMYPGKAALRLVWILNEDNIETKLIIIIFPTFELLKEAISIIGEVLKYANITKSVDNK